MKPEKLVAMANQIAAFFRAYSDEEAAAGIKRHVTAFWTPSMRARLEEWSVECERTGLDPLVTLALRRPAVADSPVRGVTSPLQESGQMATDAG